MIWRVVSQMQTKSLVRDMISFHINQLTVQAPILNLMLFDFFKSHVIWSLIDHGSIIRANWLETSAKFFQCFNNICHWTASISYNFRWVFFNSTVAVEKQTSHLCVLVITFLDQIFICTWKNILNNQNKRAIFLPARQFAALKEMK